MDKLTFYYRSYCFNNPSDQRHRRCTAKSHIPTHIRPFTVTWDRRRVGWTKGKKGDDGSRRHRGRGWVGTAPTRGWNSRAHARTSTTRVRTQPRDRRTDRQRPGMLRRTYYGARQYLNTLDGKVVHEGEIGAPLCSGVRRVRARGWTGKTMSQQERRNISQREREG